jgi:hypothetical protein
MASKENDHAKCRGFSNFAWPDAAHVDTHEHSGRDCDGHRERPPRAFSQRFHDDQAERGEDNDHDAKGANEGDATGDWAHFHFHHFTERAAVASH